MTLQVSATLPPPPHCRCQGRRNAPRSRRALQVQGSRWPPRKEHNMETHNDRAARSSPLGSCVVCFPSPPIWLFSWNSLFCDVLTSGDVLVSRKLPLLWAFFSCLWSWLSSTVDTTVSSTIDLREKSRFLLFYYSYSRPLREVRCFHGVFRKHRTSRLEAPGRLFEGVACPSAPGRDLLRIFFEILNIIGSWLYNRVFLYNFQKSAKFCPLFLVSPLLYIIRPRIIGIFGSVLNNEFFYIFRSRSGHDYI